MSGGSDLANDRTRKKQSDNTWPLHLRRGTLLGRHVAATGSNKVNAQEEILAASSSTEVPRRKCRGWTHGRAHRGGRPVQEVQEEVTVFKCVRVRLVSAARKEHASWGKSSMRLLAPCSLYRLQDSKLQRKTYLLINHPGNPSTGTPRAPNLIRNQRQRRRTGKTNLKSIVNDVRVDFLKNVVRFFWC